MITIKDKCNIRRDLKETSSEVRRRTSLILNNWLRALCSSGLPVESSFPRGPGSKKIDVPTSTAYSIAESIAPGESSSKP